MTIIAHGNVRNYQLTGFGAIDDCAQAYTQFSLVRYDVVEFAKQTDNTLLHCLYRGKQPPPEIRADMELVICASSIDSKHA